MKPIQKNLLISYDMQNLEWLFFGKMLEKIIFLKGGKRTGYYYYCFYTPTILN